MTNEERAEERLARMERRIVALESELRGMRAVDEFHRTDMMIIPDTQIDPKFLGRVQT